MDHPLDYLLRSPVPGSDSGNGPVLPIRNVIEGRDVYALYLRRRPEKPGLVPVFPPGLPVQLHHLRQQFLPLTDERQINEVRHRLGVVHGGASGNDQRPQFRPVLRPQGQSGQVQHVQHGGVSHLVAHGEGHDVELTHRVPGLQGKKRDSVFPQLLLHVGPGSKRPLAPYAGHVVEHPVQDTEAQIAHADLVGVREAEGEAEIHLALVFFDLVIFPSHIAGRFLHTG